MALQITITNAGRAEIINANNTGTGPVVITEVGFGTGQYTPLKTRTALQAQVKRVSTIAGQAVAPDTIHVVAKDEGESAYNVGEFGLFSASGTLIAVYSQPAASGWIIQKAAASTLLLATDIILESLSATSITFGDVSFINPPATGTVAGVTKLVNTLTSTDTTSALTAAMGKKLQDEKEPSVTAGTTAQYLRGDKTWRDFATDVRTAVLTGLSTATATAVAATDSVLVAIGKLQAQVTGLATSKLNATANAVSASKLATGRTIALGGDLSGSATFDGTANITINAEVADNSHGHAIANVNGLQSALDAKFDKTGGTVQGPVYVTAPGLVGLNGLQPGNGDSASDIANNLKITSWFGIGFSPSVSGQAVPVDEYSHWFNTRTGGMGWRGQAVGKGAGITELNASALSAGTVPDARLSGTYNGVNISGNAGTATRLATSRTIALGGDLSGSATFNGTNDITINAEVADNSHAHSIANVSGLQGALDSKFDKNGGTVGNITIVSNAWAVASLQGQFGDRMMIHAGGISGINELRIGRYSRVDGSLLGLPFILDMNTGQLTLAQLNGNAATATRLATARTINGVAFDGTGNITIDGAPPGAVGHFAMASPPTGWLKANGAAVSRSAYADLFAAIGTTYGSGNGSTTFNLPDLRGEFLRGWDDGRGADAGRAFGSAQAGQIESHSHTIQTGLNDISGSRPAVVAPGQTPAPVAGAVSATGGNETRPRNIALLACIKF